MKARALIEAAAFGPETVKAMGKAFDETWARIGPAFSNIPGEVEAARIRLAEAILSVTTDGETEVAAIRANAIYEMARHYSSRYRGE